MAKGGRRTKGNIMASAKKSATKKSTTKKSTTKVAKKASLSVDGEARTSAVEVSPPATAEEIIIESIAPTTAPLPEVPAVAVPAPPSGFTWSFDQSTGNLILVPTAEAAQEVAEAKEEKAEKVSGKTIRNLRYTPIHFRFFGYGEKPYRVELMPRTMSGDTVTIPASCTQDTTFVKGHQMGLFEIITRQEATANAMEAPLDGYRSRQLNIVTPDETTVDHYEIEELGKGKSSQLHRKDFAPVVQQPVQQDPYHGANMYEGVGPRIVAMPGSDPQLTAQFQSTQARRPSPQEVSTMQQQTGRPEHDSGKLVDKGIMNPLPQVVGIQHVQGM